MGYSSLFLNSPYPWVFVCGFFCAAALNRASRPFTYPRWRVADPERARTAKWMFFTLFLSLAVVAALAAIFIPGPRKILDIKLLYFFLATSGFFFLVFRFKKSIGLVAVIALIALALTMIAFLQSLTAFTGETEIGQVRILDVREGEMKIEVIPEDGLSRIRWMAGSYFAPVVRVVIFEDFFVFLGAKTWYRFDGITSFESESTEEGRSFRQQDTDLTFPSAPGISEKLWDLYERYEARIPGVRTVQVEMDLKRARELSVYSLRIQNDGGLQILEVY
jgi:hypothetical protein